MQTVRISEMLEQAKPAWIAFIVGLGYSQAKAEKFAEGYAAELAKLPILGKLRALERQDDRCMTAGFEAAGIDEAQAHRRAASGREPRRPKPKSRRRAPR